MSGDWHFPTRSRMGYQTKAIIASADKLEAL